MFHNNTSNRLTQIPDIRFRSGDKILFSIRVSNGTTDTDESVILLFYVINGVTGTRCFGFYK